MVLDTFTVYNHVRFAIQNIKDFIFTCRERRHKKKMKKKQLGPDGAAAVSAQEELEQKKPLCDGDGGRGGGAGGRGSGDSGGTTSPLSDKRTVSDSDPPSDSGSVRGTPRLTGSGRRRMRSMSTTSDISIPPGVVMPRKKKNKPKKEQRSKIIGMLAIRKRPESVKKKKKRRPRPRPSVSVPKPASEPPPTLSGRPSGVHEDIIEEDVRDLALYDTADAEPKQQSSTGEASSTTESTSVVQGEPKSKPPVRKTSGKGQKKGKKKSTKRKASGGKGGKGANKKGRAAEKSGKKTPSRKATVKKTHSTQMNNLSARDQGLEDYDLALGASAAQLGAGTSQSGDTMANIDASQPSTSKFHGDKYDSNIDIHRNFHPDSKDTMTIKAKTFREKLASIRLRKKKEFNLDPELGLSDPSYMTGAKRQNADVQRSLNTKKLNIPSTIPESDIPYTQGRSTGPPVSVIAGHDDVPEGVTFEQKTGLLSRISRGMKKKLNYLHFPGFAKPDPVNSEPVLYHPPSEIVVDGCVPPRLGQEHYDHPKPPIPINTTKPPQKNLTLDFLEKEFSDGEHVDDGGPPITPEELQEMYRVKLPGQDLHQHRGYIPPSSRYLDKLRHSGKSPGRVPLRSWETAGVISPDLMKNRISLSEEGPSTSYDNNRQDLDLAITGNATEENPWQLHISDGPPGYEQNGGSIEENDQVNSIVPGTHGKQKPLNFQSAQPFNADLNSPSGASSDGSTRPLTSDHSGASFLKCFPGVSQVQRLLSPRHGEKMCYNVEEGHLEDVDESFTCPSPARLAAALGQRLPFRRGMSRSGTKDTMDIPDTDLDHGGPSLLRKLILPCQNKRYSLDDTCVETIAKDLQEEHRTKADLLYEARRSRNSGRRRTSEDPGNDSDFSSYYRAVLPKY